MVVVVLVGIVTAMILPEMRGTYTEALLRASSRDLVNACSLASSRAISLNHAHRVRLDPRSGRFTLEQRKYLPGTGPGFAAVRDAPGGAGTIDSRIRVEVLRPNQPQAEDQQQTTPWGEEAPEGSDAAGPIFYPDGTAEPVEVLLRDEAGFGLALRINPVTSRIRVVKVNRQ
jgi:Tfp pilus assembly protein FimT